MKFLLLKKITPVLICLLVAGTTLALQQDPVELAPVSRTYALTGVNIIQAPGRKIDMGTVVIKNGLVHAVGKNVSIPPDAIVIKADSMYVYAGFIDGLSRTGVAKPKEEKKDKPRDPGNPPHDQAGITPQNDVRNSLSHSESSVDELRALGFTAVQAVPHGGFLAGYGSLILLNNKSADAMVLLPKVSLYSELQGNQNIYPSTVIGVMAKWRELYRQALQSKNYESMYASNRSGLERPATDRILEAFYPVIDKRAPVLFKGERILDIHRILALQSDLGFALTLGDVKEGWDALSKIKSSGAKVFLSLELPEEKKEESKDKKEELKKEEPKEETKKEADLEKERLEKRKADFISKYTAQAATFQKAGVPFGFSTMSAKPKDIQPNLRRMIKAGLTEDQALAALTTTPAQLLGVSDRLGSVDNGKIANLVVSTKPYFDEKAKVRYVFVDGVLFKYEAKDEKPVDKNAKVDIVGTWEITTETPGGKVNGTLEITKEGDTYSGKTSNDQYGSATLEKVSLNGNVLTYQYTLDMQGQSIKVEVEVTLEGNTFKGNVTVPMGSFPTEGKKKPNL
jgi:hypothetical protein